MDSRLFSRREAVRVFGAAALFGVAAWPGAASAKATGGDGRLFRFLAVNDLHHAKLECDPWFEALVAQMKTHEGIEFVLIAGDLSDTAEPASLASIRDRFATLGVPVHVQIGNHDYKTDSDRHSYEQTFPDRLNYSFEHRGWQFVGIDSTEGTKADKTQIQPPTLRFLDDSLPKLDRRKPTVVFTHFPLNKTVRMAPQNSDAVLARFRDFNLQGVLGGHYHAYTVGSYGDAPVLTNRCCSRIRSNHDGTTDKGYWLMTADDGRLWREFVEFKRA